MTQVKFHSGRNIPLEMHKVRIIQKLNLLPVEERQAALVEAGYNTFLLQNKDVFLDMLTDSGVNAMSDRQEAAMLMADDSYAGSMTFTRLNNKLIEIFDMPYFLPTHQGRAAENVLSTTWVREGSVVPMNFHFTTSKEHIVRMGGRVIEVLAQEGRKVTSTHPFKGNIDVALLDKTIAEVGAQNVPFVRMEAGTNLIGGQPFSVANVREVRAVCDKYGVRLLMDASLLADNLYFIKEREEEFKDVDVRAITKELASMFDVIYFSARKLGFARGGGIMVRSEETYREMRGYIPLYEGFLTYGGMSVREMEAIAVGLDETMDMDYISQGPLFIKYMTEQLLANGVPVVTPSGGLGCHLDATRFLPHISQENYPAGSLATALYLASGVRGMERGTMSEAREPDGTQLLADMELVRLALPRRVFTMSQVDYAVDRVTWLWENRDLVGGLRFIEEPAILRFFYGRLEPVGDWPSALAAKFRADFQDSL
ncbi:MAG: tryptophanase [Actinomycetaceae bacterium]|nr:tryptophanase [Actinomycetaceae bacterium]